MEINNSVACVIDILFCVNDRECVPWLYAQRQEVGIRSWPCHSSPGERTTYTRL